MDYRRDAFGEVLESRRKEHLFVEVVLIDGVNDSPDQAEALAALLKPLPTRASVNLLPYNDTGHPAFRASSREAVTKFQKILTEYGYVATIRTARYVEPGIIAENRRSSPKLFRKRNHHSLAVTSSIAQVHGLLLVHEFLFFLSGWL